LIFSQNLTNFSILAIHQDRARKLAL